VNKLTNNGLNDKINNQFNVTDHQFKRAVKGFKVENFKTDLLEKNEFTERVNNSLEAINRNNSDKRGI
jgi:hypothetical protein